MVFFPQVTPLKTPLKTPPKVRSHSRSTHASRLMHHMSWPPGIAGKSCGRTCGSTVAMSGAPLSMHSMRQTPQPKPALCRGLSTRKPPPPHPPGPSPGYNPRATTPGLQPPGYNPALQQPSLTPPLSALCPLARDGRYSPSTPHTLTPPVPPVPRRTRPLPLHTRQPPQWTWLTRCG